MPFCIPAVCSDFPFEANSTRCCRCSVSDGCGGHRIEYPGTLSDMLSQRIWRDIGVGCEYCVLSKKQRL